MSRITYQNFSIKISRKDELKRTYLVSVNSDPGGQASGEFAIDELKIKTSAMSLSSDDPATGWTVNRHAKLINSPASNGQAQYSRVVPPDFEESKHLGTLLFDSVFKDSVRDLLSASLGAIRRSNSSEKLRLQLNLTNAPELATLPWEYVYNKATRHFYAQTVETPIVRFLEQGNPIRTLIVKPPLRMLVALSSPTDQPPLKVKDEWEQLKAALLPLEKDKLIELDLLEKTTRDGLRQKLLQKEYHIFHFIGHGSFQNGSGALVFENNQGSSQPFNGSLLARLLSTFDSLRLAIINACEGASSSNSDSYAGVAQNLLNYGNLPAVIAMQFAITDKAAIRFAEVFYDSLAHGFPVDAALSIARMEMIDAEDDVEWATPVLFMRANSGELFNLSDAPSRPDPEPNLVVGDTANPLYPFYQDILATLRDGQLVFFLGLESNLYGRAENPNWQPGENLPSNKELASYLTRELQLTLDEPLGVAGVSQCAFADEKQIQLNNIMRAIFNNRTIKPSPLHQFLADVLSRGQRDKDLIRSEDPLLRRFVIVTTTYDNLLEQAFLGETPGAGPIPNFHVLSYRSDDVSPGNFIHAFYAGSLRPETTVIEKPNEYKKLDGDEFPVIIKLPGGVEGIEFKYAIAEDNFFFFAGRSLPKLLPPQMMVKLQNSRHLYLGYKVRDWNLRAFLYSIWGATRQRMTSWAVLPDARKTERLFWNFSGVKVIEASLDTFINGLRKSLESEVK